MADIVLCIFVKKLFSNVSQSAIDLVKRLLCVDPNKRITVEEMENHPWFMAIIEDVKEENPPQAKAARGRGRGRGRARGARGGRGSGRGSGKPTRNGESKHKNTNKKLKTENNNSGSETSSRTDVPRQDSGEDGAILDERAETPPIEKRDSSDGKIKSLDSDEDQEGPKLKGLITANNLSDSYPISQQEQKAEILGKTSIEGTSSDPSSSGDKNLKTNAKNDEYLEKPPTKKRRVRTR